MRNKSATSIAATSIAITALILAAGSVSAFAEDAKRLSGDQLKGYLTGNTIYVDIQPGGPFGDGGLSPFYYGHDGRFAAKLVTGKITGSWKISADASTSYCIDIVEANKTFCTDVIRKNGSIEHHSVGLKRLMGPVIKIVPGNDADL